MSTRRGVRDDRIEVPVGGRRFRFVLCRKPARLGDVAIDQWWMREGSLDPTRGREAAAGNFRPVVDFYRAVAEAAGVLDADACETYLLARLLPASRSNGARRIFADGRPDRPRCSRAEREEREASDRDLEAALRADRGRLDAAGFHRDTARWLGREAYPDAAWEEYRRLTADLFGDGREAVLRSDEASVGAVATRWADLDRRLGRRAGKELEKLVLDVISYECRAAFHRCYSAVWNALVPVVGRRSSPAFETAMFHSFWHQDRPRPAAGGGPARLHLFHGHVFALHPAGGDFLRTPAGGELVGAWLREPESETAWQRLLRGLSLAALHYANRRLHAAEARLR